MSDIAKLETLEKCCRSLGKLAVAFSGGLDSRFLLYAANRAGAAVRALHISGPHIPLRETSEARQWAQEHGVPFISFQIDPLPRPGVRANGRDRCYHCKHAMFSLLRTKTQEGETLCDGTNSSDFASYRPGLQALKELEVCSPLAQAGLGKNDIRELAGRIGMDRPDQKARPCLLTRYEYGLAPNAGTLAALDKAEQQIEALLSPENHDAPPFRLRLTKEGPVLHIQSDILADEQKAALDVLLVKHGFHWARVELTDQISGYFDRQSGLKG